MRLLFGTVWCLALSFAVRPAAAALTQSEKAQIAGFVRAGELGNASRVRALVARPDLEMDEAAEPLVAGFSVVRFDERHEKFTRELLFGPGSAAARSTLAPAVVKALLARATRALAEMPVSDAELAKADRVAREIVSIHRFVDEAIANAGHPPADGHDAGAQIHDDALGKMAALYADHVTAHSRDLAQGSPVSSALVPVRAATELALIDLGRGILPRHEVADKLGLTGSRRTLFERHGTLLEDGGTASEPRLEQALRFLNAAPRAADGLSLWIFHKGSTGSLATRGNKAAARVSLSAAPAGGSERGLWADDVAPSKPDRELGEIAYSAAWIATRAAFKKSPELRAIAASVAERAARAGDDGLLAKDLALSVLDPIGSEHLGVHGASPELFTAHALRLVLLDAPRATDLAMTRAIAGRDEPLATLLVALSVLAAENDNPKELAVGRTKDDGSIEAYTLGDVKQTGALVTSFSYDKNAVSVSMAPSGAVEKLSLNGAAPKLGSLARVRHLPKPGESWVAGQTKWEKLGGAPLGVGLDDGRFVLGAPKDSTGFDAVVSGKPQRDQAVHALVEVADRGGGLLVRGQPGEKSYDAVVLLIVPGSPAKATLLVVDGKAKALELAAMPLDAAGPGGYAASLSVKGQKVSAVIDGKLVEATLSRAAGSGRAGLMVPAGGRIEVTGFGPGASAPRKQKNPTTPAPSGKKTK